MSVDWQQLRDIAPALGVVLDVLLALGASSQVILNKTDARSATAWVRLIWLAPFVEAPRLPADLDRELGRERARLGESSGIEALALSPGKLGKASRGRRGGVRIH